MSEKTIYILEWDSGSGYAGAITRLRVTFEPDFDKQPQSHERLRLRPGAFVRRDDRQFARGPVRKRGFRFEAENRSHAVLEKKKLIYIIVFLPTLKRNREFI